MQYLDLKNELNFSETYRAEFMSMINELNESDLEVVRIDRKEVGQSKKRGGYLNRMAYDESVHT
tara:strand:+ start:2090 stop:2281 length:192 start_codon:yes stop_codon:yes gene_type:complete